MISSDVDVKPGMMITWTSSASPGAFPAVSHEGPTGGFVVFDEPEGGSSTLLVIAVDGIMRSSCPSSNRRRWVRTVLWNGRLFYIPQDWFGVMDVVT